MGTDSIDIERTQDDIKVSIKRLQTWPYYRAGGKGIEHLKNNS